MANAEPASVNADQTAYWNDVAGRTWTDLQSLLDRQLEPLGEAVIAALQPRTGDRIMDIGCGCGDTTLALARRVGPTGSAVGVDISAPMLERARARAAKDGVANASFLQADAQVHAFRDDFDAVFSRFGVMFFSDPVGAFRNIRKSMKPGGRLGFVCWRPFAENRWMTAPMQAAAPYLPPAPAAPVDPLAPGPFAFADAGRVRGILSDADFSDIEISSNDTEIGADSVDDAIETALRVGPLGAQLREAPDRREAVLGALRDTFRPLAGARGVKLPSAAWIVTARN